MRGMEDSAEVRWVDTVPLATFSIFAHPASRRSSMFWMRPCVALWPNELFLSTSKPDMVAAEYEEASSSGGMR